MFFGRWVADYPDTDGFIYTLLHTHAQYGRISGTPETDALMERARIETDPRVRHKIYRELDAVIARRALVLPLFHEQAYRFAQPGLGGIEVHLSPPIVPYEKLFAR
jgi:ABC-type oligopeptide transport system substrate-binding subunit